MFHWSEKNEGPTPSPAQRCWSLSDHDGKVGNGLVRCETSNDWLMLSDVDEEAFDAKTFRCCCIASSADEIVTTKGDTTLPLHHQHPVDARF